MRLERIDPELVPYVAAMPVPQSPLDISFAFGMRPSVASLFGSQPLVPDDVEFTCHTLRFDDRDIQISIRKPAKPASDTGTLPFVFFIHGGGLVSGSAFLGAPRLDRWCLATQCAIVAVEYGLAPEHHYPEPLDDCVAGYRATLAAAEGLGLDSERVVVAGVSAGGGLAAGLALRLRDAGLGQPSGLLLAYPMLDDRTVVPPDGIDDAPTWTYEKNDICWRAYLGPDLGALDPDERVVPCEAAPARAASLAGLPPTFISVGSVDIFCSEDVQFAARLIHDAVPVELHVHPGAYHGFDNHAAETAVGQRFNAEIESWIRRRLRLGHG